MEHQRRKGRAERKAKRGGVTRENGGEPFLFEKIKGSLHPSERKPIASAFAAFRWSESHEGVGGFYINLSSALAGFFSKKERVPRTPPKENHLRRACFRFYYGQIRSDGDRICFWGCDVFWGRRTAEETFFSKKESLPRPPFKENHLRRGFFCFYYGQIRSNGDRICFWSCDVILRTALVASQPTPLWLSDHRKAAKDPKYQRP